MIKFKDLPDTDTPINAENLNNNFEEASIAISATEPTTKERVWFKKGKNLFNIKNIPLTHTLIDDNSFSITGVSGTLFEYDFKENTQYTITGYLKHNTSGYGQYIQVNYTDGTNNISYTDKTENTYFKIVTPSNKTISNITLGYSTYAIVTTISELQIEQGTTATEYEPYVEKEIYTKNANGVFEKYTNAEQIETITNSNGTAIKYPDGTMICRGQINIEANVSSKDQYFPVPFVDTKYDVGFTNINYLSPFYCWSVGDYNASYVKVVCRDLVTQDIPTQIGKAHYIAIGRWK